MMNVDIGVTIVDGTHDAASGLNLNTPPNLILLIPVVNDTGPLIKFPPVLSVDIDIAPDDIPILSSSTPMNASDAIEFLIIIFHLVPLEIYGKIFLLILFLLIQQPMLAL